MTRRTGDAAAWDALWEWARLALPGDTVAAAQRAPLPAYLALLQRWNARIALVARHDLATLLTRHLADALVAAAHCGAATRVADLGSGAGFPAVPIALLHPRAAVHCFESIGKKASFLAAVRATLGMRNLFVCETRIESAALAAEHRASYELITSRALADLDVLRGLAFPLLRPGGLILAMRSASAPAPAEAKIVDYLLPDGTPRRLVIESAPGFT